MEFMLVGYARVSTQKQNLDRQMIALEMAGCARIYSEKASGRGGNLAKRPELEAAIECLKPSDTLILAEWDRATRSMQDGIVIMTRVHARDANLKALDRTWLDLSTPIGKGILAFLSALAEDERERIVKRAEDGRAAARDAGARFGRRSKLNHHQVREVEQRLDAGESCRVIARSYNVHHSTISRIGCRMA